MKICPQCQQQTNIISILELKCNGKLIQYMELCPKCRDEFLKNILLHTPKVEDVLPTSAYQLPVGTKIVTKEQLFEILQGNLDPANLTDEPEVGKIKPCPNCNTTVENLSETGRLGCPECYDHFEDLVVEFAEQIQGGTQHIGKEPKSKEELIKEIKLKLAYAKEHNNFLEAAKLVTRLKELQ